MQINLQPNVDQAMRIAKAIAKENQHEKLAIPHLLMALFHNEIGLASELSTWGKDIYYLREWADLRLNKLPKTSKAFDEVAKDTSIKRTLEVAEMESLKLGQDQISPEAILAAICKPNVAFTKEQLKSFPITEEEILKQYSSSDNIKISNGETSSENKVKSSNRKAIEKYTIDKIAMAANGKMDSIVGRDKEMRLLIEVLGRRSKPNPIIIGEPGTGKTALVEGFAHLLQKEQVPEFLKGAVLFELDNGALIAGASYKGEIEERLKKILKELKSFPRGILFIDEIHLLLDPNAGFGGVANLLKPELA
ncbi:MAG: AAA family ATPase, partial [Bacteroidota bacterium]